MARIVVALVVVSIAVLAPDAHAGWRVDRATAIARIVWHHPCVDRMELRFARPWHQLLWAADGWVMGGCVVYINSRTWRPWTRLCTVVLHEAGHLADYQDPNNHEDPSHSRNPQSVMYAEDDRDYGTNLTTGMEEGGDPRCQGRGRPFLRRHAVTLSPPTGQ